MQLSKAMLVAANAAEGADLSSAQQLSAVQGGVRGGVASSVAEAHAAAQKSAPQPVQEVTIIKAEPVRALQLDDGDKGAILNFVSALLDFLDCLGVFDSGSPTNSTTSA